MVEGRRKGIIGATAVHGHTAGLDRYIYIRYIAYQWIDRKIKSRISKKIIGATGKDRKIDRQM